MFRLEEKNKVDFLTSAELKKTDLHTIEKEFESSPEEEVFESEEDVKEEEERTEMEEKEFPRLEIPFSDNGEKTDTIINNEKETEKIRLKIRFDYRGTTRPARFFFGRKSTEEAAEELRDQKMSLWQNMPLQGIEVEDIKVYDIYTLLEEDEDYEEEVAYAPLEIVVSADSLEDCVYLVSREEFRRVEILEPPVINISSKSLEKMFIKFSEFFRRFYEEYR